jgi:hypothetical protein
MMDNIFGDLITQGLIFVYIDDIIIATETLEQHRQLVHKVLTRLAKNNLFASLEKCLFEVHQVEFLGMIISYNQVQIIQDKVKAILEWPTLKTVEDIQKFCRLANYYQRFIENFSYITKPLDKLIGKELWKWQDEQQVTFKLLKRAFTQALVLAIYNHQRESQIKTDASGYTMGAVFSQLQEDNNK